MLISPSDTKNRGNKLHENIIKNCGNFCGTFLLNILDDLAAQDPGIEFMARIPIKTSAAEDILHFDDDTLRGKEKKCHLISGTCKMLNVVIVGSKLCLYRSCCKHSYSRKNQSPPRE